MLVALLAEKADIQYDSELTDPSHLVEEIRALGFGANLLSDSEGYQQGKLDLTVSAVISTTCMCSSHLLFVVRPCHYLHTDQSIVHVHVHCIYQYYYFYWLSHNNNYYFSHLAF